MFDQVFLSYANVDLGQATRLKSFLDEVKIRSFFAPDIRAGADWPRVLEIKIRNSAVLVVVLSAGANNADGMRQEVALAEGLDKPILVFRPGSAAETRE